MSKAECSPTVEPSDGVVEGVYVSSSSSYDRLDGSQDASAPSSPEQASSGYESVSRKRKSRSQSSVATKSRTKRLRALYTDQYRQLYNETVLDAANCGSKGYYEQRQLGLTTWSSSEKVVFFRTLALKGRDDLASISSAIVTKSEPEVRAYLLLLDEVSAEQQIYKPYNSLLDRFEIPAALEVSQECEVALEGAAGALAILQEKEDVKAEKRKHGDQWRLTSVIAGRIHEQLQEGPNGEAAVDETVPAAILLDLKAFLTLTKRLFMNSPDPELNYRTYATARIKSLSILHTAFSDFHNLVVRITRRLVQCAIFLAMSRLRAMDEKKRAPRRLVRGLDMVAALEISGMKPNAHDYWVGLARRCKLNVYKSDADLGKPIGERLDYETVENILEQGRARREKTGFYQRIPLEVFSRPATPSHGRQNSTTSSETASEYQDSASDSDGTSSVSSNLPLDHRSSDSLQAQDNYDQKQDAYISALDHQASLREETRLWAILGREPPSPIQPEDVDIPQEPVPEPKPLEEIADWRESISYAAEWEILETPVPEAEFQTSNKRSRRNGDALPQSLDGENERGVSAADQMFEERAGDMASSSGGDLYGDIHEDMGDSEGSFELESVERISLGEYSTGQPGSMQISDNESENETSSEASRRKYGAGSVSHIPATGGAQNEGEERLESPSDEEEGL